MVRVKSSITYFGLMHGQTLCDNSQVGVSSCWCKALQKGSFSKQRFEYQMFLWISKIDWDFNALSNSLLHKSFQLKKLESSNKTRDFLSPTLYRESKTSCHIQSHQCLNLVFSKTKTKTKSSGQKVIVRLYGFWLIVWHWKYVWDSPPISLSD